MTPREEYIKEYLKRFEDKKEKKELPWQCEQYGGDYGKIEGA